MKDPYFRIAPFYNAIMGHVDYLSWSNYVEDIVVEYSIPTEFSLELAAGTGTLGSLLNPDVVKNCIHSDLSQPMLGQMPASLSAVAMDMKHIAVRKQSLSFLFNLYDSFNYLLREVDLTQHLESVWTALKPGGFYLFDVITESMCLDYFDDVIDFQSEENVDVVRESFFDEASQIQTNRFRYYLRQENDLYQKLEDEHTQRVWAVETLERKVCEKGFRVVGLFRDFTMERNLEGATRVNFLLQKPVS